MWWVMVLDLFGCVRVRKCGCSRFVLVFLDSLSIYVFDDGVYFPSLLE